MFRAINWPAPIADLIALVYRAGYGARAPCGSRGSERRLARATGGAAHPEQRSRLRPAMLPAPKCPAPGIWRRATPRGVAGPGPRGNDSHGEARAA